MKTKLLIFLFLSASIIPNYLFAQFTQQGPKLIGTGASGGMAPYQGYSVAISSDGNTAIVGGPNDNNMIGAIWIFIQIGGVWTQQGPKLVGTGAIGGSFQGRSVAISSDGNTAIVGGSWDHSYAGAVWIFVRSGGVWTQQGPKLVGTGAVGSQVSQGYSVAISSDGNTVIEGGSGDEEAGGAVWIFTRSGSVWTQQGSKLVGTGRVGTPNFGWSVAISSDGNTAIIGGASDNILSGAIWVFTRSGSVWTQQGPKLVGTGAVGSQVSQGMSVAVSSDGNTIIEGGYGDSGGSGAVWIFTRSAGVWTQQGPKLVGTGMVGNSHQGISVSVSSDGNTVIVGGFGDNNNAGAIWDFTRIGGIWMQQGPKFVGSGAVGNALQGVSVAISSDGNTAIEGGYQDNSGIGAAWVFVNQGVGIIPISNEPPKDFGLSQNYPNPFNPETVIRFQVAAYRLVKLSAYDILGREISTLINGQFQPGTYEVNFDGTNFPDGVYFYKLQTENFSETKKMILVK